MLEIREVSWRDGRLDFIPSEGKFPFLEKGGDLAALLLEEGWIAHSHFGDPELAHCSVYRKKGERGGLFIMSALDPLFAAWTDSNFVFAMACGRFAELAANIRYGADVWEEMEGSND